LVKRIAAAYDELGHELGWRFLATPSRTLSPETRLAFVGLNPGGSVYQPPVASVEAGSAYRLENWGADGGPSRIQTQVRLLYHALGERLERSPADLMNETLAAHFCPFRSPGWDSLDHRGESIAFSRNLWSSILEIARPSVLICLSDAVRYLDELLEHRGYRLRSTPQRLSAGWGTVSVRLSHRDSPTGDALLVGLPHLSRFGMFGRPGSETMLDELVESVAVVLSRKPVRAAPGTLGSQLSTSWRRTPPSDPRAREPLATEMGRAERIRASPPPLRRTRRGLRHTRTQQHWLRGRAGIYTPTACDRRRQPSTVTSSRQGPAATLYTTSRPGSPAKR
jgi:hypothetical protein